MGFNLHFRVYYYYYYYYFGETTFYLDFHLIGECYDEGQKAVSQQERSGHFS